MAAWYVLSALGLYPVCPGKPEYICGGPALPVHATIHLMMKTLLIDAPGNSATTPYVRGLTVNGAYASFDADRPCHAGARGRAEIRDGRFRGIRAFPKRFLKPKRGQVIGRSGCETI